MTNDYYNADGNPQTNSSAKSATMRTIFANIASAFNKLPNLSGNGNKIVAVNSGGTALESIATTGTGNAVRADGAVLIAPTLGAATATSINKVAITAPATASTITVADGKTFSASNTMTLSGTDGATLNISDVVKTSVLSQSSGAGLAGFIQSGAGAVATTVQEDLRTTINVLQFMTSAQRSACTTFAGNVDVTAAIQSALDAAYLVGKSVFLPSGKYLVSAQLRNKGVSMIGEGRFNSEILAATTFPAATAILLVQPVSGAYIEFLELARFSIQPTNGGTKYGGNCIFMSFPDPTNLAKLHMHDVYLYSGNDYSLYTNNTIAVNVQGVPSVSLVERCLFAEGTKMVGVGDSNSISNNIMQSTGGGRCGIYLYHVDGGGGVASHTVIRENNMDCDGGAIYVIRGRNIKILDNNIELSAGSGTPNGAVIDIDGSSGTIPWSNVSDNHIGIFGAATPTSAIRINGSDGAKVAHNTILSGVTVASAISITASASNTIVGEMNEISSQFTTPVSNLGTATRGVPVAVTPINGFGNYPGYQTLTCFKSPDGLVTVSGVLSAPATPNGIVLANLPSGFRPSLLQRAAVGAVVGGAVSPQAIEIGTTGNIAYYGSNACTLVEISITFQTVNHVIGSL